MSPLRIAAATVALLAALAPALDAQRVPLTSPPAARRLAATPPPNLAGCTSYTAPQSVSSSGGVLQTSLIMAPGSFRIGDSTYTRNIYNGQYTAPVLRMNPSERLAIDVSNAMRPNAQQPQNQVSWTNQHYHGMIVTPLPDSGDNVVPLQVRQGQTNRNRFWVPPYQSQGMMWYHPHPHGSTATQVSGGLAGALIIGDLLASFPQYRGATERVMYIKDTRNNASTAYLNVNGNPCTVMNIRPGEQQLWRIGNMTAGTWLNLKLGEPGRNYRFILLALDGNHLTRPTLVDSIFLSPGGRAEAIVIGGTGMWSGARFYTDSVVTSFNRTTGQRGSVSPRVDLGWLVTSGAAQPVAARALDPRGEPEEPVLADSIRRLVEDTDVDTFTIHYQLIGGNLLLNDSSYNPVRLDRAVAVGRTQEWTLINDTWFLHTFHIHQTDFVVTKINGVPQPDSVHLDNVHLGIHQLPNGRWAGDTVVIRFKFNPIAAGPFVYHCHDLFHEDAGMMANVCVYDPARGQSPATCRQNWFPGGPAPDHSGHAHGGGYVRPAAALQAAVRERRR